jgi:hypothetical protein
VAQLNDAPFNHSAEEGFRKAAQYLLDIGFETKQKRRCDVPDRYSLKGIAGRY